MWVDDKNTLDDDQNSGLSKLYVLSSLKVYRLSGLDIRSNSHLSF